MDYPADFFPPDLPETADIYLKALQLLSADRPFALGYGATATGQIPFPSISAFAHRYGVDADSFDRFVRVLRLVDAAVVSDINIRANKKP